MPKRIPNIITILLFASLLKNTIKCTLKWNILLKSISIDVYQYFTHLSWIHVFMTIIEELLHFFCLLDELAFHTVKILDHLTKFSGLFHHAILILYDKFTDTTHLIVFFDVL